MTYADQGRLSKAWFLQKIKRLGEQGGISYLSMQIKGGGLNYTGVREAVEDLVDAGYVQKLIVGDDARKARYKLTEVGHQYLAEHRQEMVEPTPPDQSSRSKSKLFSIVPVTPDLINHISTRDEPTYEPDELAAPRADDVPPEVTSSSPPPLDEPEYERTVGHLDVPPIQLLPPASPITTIKQTAKDALLEILYEKYGDSITAKELIERLP